MANFFMNLLFIGIAQSARGRSARAQHRTFVVMTRVTLGAMLMALSCPANAVTGAENELKLRPPVALDSSVAKLAAEPYASGEREAVGGAAGGRTQVRQLMSFEDGARDGQPIPELTKAADNLQAIYVQDNGVTDGKWCARLTLPAGGDFGVMILDGEAVKNWAGFDYFAMDLFTEGDEPHSINFELWDRASHNYATRFTIDQPTHAGRQTLLFPINRARRNGKEGRDWDELEAKDKIDLAALKMIKIFTEQRRDRPTTFWIDNLRLMQADAAKPKMRASLPKAVAAAFDFGSGDATPGFTGIGPANRQADTGGFVSTQGLASGGTGWPDRLSGTYVIAPHNQPFTFKAIVPNGKYLAWLCAGPVISAEQSDPHFLLKLNDKILHEDTPDFAAYDSENYLYRFLWTQYSQRPHALWLDYINRMFPVVTTPVEVSDGQVTLTACDYFVSSLVLVPADNEADFHRMAAKLQQSRMDAFEQTQFIPPHTPPQPKPGDGDYLLYIPAEGKNVLPWSGPSEGEPVHAKLDLAGAPGQNVFVRIAIAPFRELGDCRMVLADLTSPKGAQIPQSQITGHFLNYRGGGREIGEMALLPTLAFHGEEHITQTLWLWLTIPLDAKPGRYAGNFTFHPANSKPKTLPVELEVYPFKLADALPASLGMYYGGRSFPRPPAGKYWDVIRQQLLWQRRIGFTASTLMADAQVTGVNESTGEVTLHFDETGANVAKAAGFGRDPAQMQMASQLGIARAIGRRLIGPAVDRNPGAELREPKFAALHRSAMRQYRKFLDSLELPYAVEVVDEPREIPNPWNRNLADTITYADLLSEEGFTHRFITPMSDESGGKDYSTLVDHADVLSIHAWPLARKLRQGTLAANKTLWFYNSGMSRFAWGAYPWAHGASGRFEWHWSAPEINHSLGYPGDDWYNPFTSTDATAPNAPIESFPGGFLYKSTLLNAADGITDWTYLYTLERALREHKKSGTKGDVVQKAEAFVKEVKSRVPDFPGTEGNADPIDKLEGWRTAAAGLLKELTAP